MAAVEPCNRLIVDGLRLQCRLFPGPALILCAIADASSWCGPAISQFLRYIHSQFAGAVRLMSLTLVAVAITGDVIELTYEETVGDPQPFVLTVTSHHISRQTS